MLFAETRVTYMYNDAQENAIENVCNNIWAILYKLVYSHDDVNKWKHFRRYWPSVRSTDM